MKTKVLAWKEQWAKKTELRELREEARWFEGEEREQSMLKTKQASQSNGCIDPYWSRSSLLEKHRQNNLGCPEQGAGAEGEEACEGDWDDEKTPNERYESDAVDPAVDLDRCQGTNGGSGGGGNLGTPRNGAQEQDM